MSFTKKKLELTITLGTGQFGETVGDTVTLSGYRMTADCAFCAGIAMSSAQIRIFGLPQEMMNRLTVVGFRQNTILAKNSILLAAGDDETGMSVVYEGSISDAWADYAAAPDVAFNIIAANGLLAAVKPVGATSFRGATKVSDIMSSLAALAGLTLDDRGVDVVLSNPYFPGSALDQIRACAEAADILYQINRQTLVIYPRVGAKNPAPIVISKDTGLVGYPRFSSKSMSLTTEFIPGLNIPGEIQVESSIGPLASGVFTLISVGYSLSCEMPNGPWFSNIECYPVQTQ
jgi:hypothetical protein